VDNPFGKSPVLVAEENGQLIGVRAFMRWEWRQGDKIYKAVRAVDTATHRQHQGKGIFKKLTLQLVDQCKVEGVDFIFNTPNTSSKPGYLKMGWMSNGKMKLNLRPVINFSRKSADFDSIYKFNATELSFPKHFNEVESSGMHTNRLGRFMQWRYANNPNIKYFACAASDASSSIIFRLKPYRFGTEFRICDSLGHIEHSRYLKEAVLASGANLITVADRLNGFSSLSLAVGPEITTRPLSFDHNFLSFSFWKPTLGDMEVF
jgi:hypothetical protein